MSQTSEPLEPDVDVVDMADADTQYTWTVPAGCKFFSMQLRQANDSRIAFAASLVATSTDPYATIKANQVYNSPGKVVCEAGMIVYMASSTADVDMEIIWWKRAA